MTQILETLLRFPVHQVGQRRELAAGQADRQGIEVHQVTGFGARQLQLHIHLVGAFLEALQQNAVEGRADLAADIPQRQAQPDRIAVEGEHALLEAIGQIVVQRTDAGQILQGRLQLQRRLFHGAGVLAGEADGQILARGPDPARSQGKALDAVGQLHPLLPLLDEFAVAGVALVAVHQLDIDRTVALAANRAPLPGGCGMAHIPGIHHLLVQALDGFLQGLLEPVEEIVDAILACAGHEADVGIDGGGLRRREETPVDLAADDQPDGKHQHAQGQHQRESPVAQGQPRQRTETAVAEMLETGIQPLAQRRAPATVPVHEGMAQVPGQNQKALDQRGDDDRNDDHRNGRHDVAHAPAHQQQGQEGGDGGQRRGHHRRQHAPRTALGGDQRILAHVVVGLGVLADHDGVIDDDAQGHDQREQADHVDALAAQVHHRQRRHEGNRNAHGHPEGHPRRQEQVENQQHQQQAPGAVFQQQQDALLDQLPAFVEHRETDVRRQGRPHLVEPLLQDLGGIQGIALFAAPQHQHRGLFAIQGDGLGAVVDTALDARQVAQGQSHARRLDQRQTRQLLGAAPLAQAAHLANAVLAPGQPGGQILAVGAQALGQLVQAQIQRQQIQRRQLDHQRFLRQTLEIHLVDAAIEQLLLKTTRPATQIALVAQAADQQTRHRFVAHDLRYPRLLGIGRQRGEAVHLLAHLLHRLGHVRAFLELHRHAGGAGGGGRGHFLEVVDQSQPLLQRNGDGLLDILGAGAAPDHADGDHVELEIGEELHIQALQREQAGQHHDRHQQVRRHLVAGKDAEQIRTIRHPQSPLPEAGATASSSPTSFTLSPSEAFGRWVTTTRSPGCRRSLSTSRQCRPESST